MALFSMYTTMYFNQQTELKSIEFWASSFSCKVPYESDKRKVSLKIVQNLFSILQRVHLSGSILFVACNV